MGAIIGTIAAVLIAAADCLRRTLLEAFRDKHWMNREERK